MTDDALTLGQLGSLVGAMETRGLSDRDRERPIRAISTDTRMLQPGDVFVALQGENFDGRLFAAQAVERGAIASILPEPQEALLRPQFCVADPLRAYQKLGRYWRDRFAIPVVGITGSVGKTTTKELVAALLGLQGPVLKTEANFNNEIGVPKTLLGLEASHRFAVVEMAMRGPGEIAELARIARPDIGAIVNVGTAHIGRLGSEAAIAAAKCELLAGLDPQTGTAVLNADNPLLMATAAEVWSGSTVTFGLENGDVRGSLRGDVLAVDGWQLPLPLPGRHNASNYLAALAIARVLGVSWEPLQAGLHVELPGGRSRRWELPQDIVLLDETYNAGFEAMVAALELLRDTPGERRVAVLGTMKELGNLAFDLHGRVGEVIRDLGLDRLYVLADEPAAEAMAAKATGITSLCLQDGDDLIERLVEELRAGDRVLFKASNSVGLGRVVEAVRRRLGGGEVS